MSPQGQNVTCSDNGCALIDHCSFIGAYFKSPEKEKGALAQVGVLAWYFTVVVSEEIGLKCALKYMGGIGPSLCP